MQYLRFTSSSCKDKGIRKFKFVTNTQFLYFRIKIHLFCLQTKIPTSFKFEQIFLLIFLKTFFVIKLNDIFVKSQIWLFFSCMTMNGLWPPMNSIKRKWKKSPPNKKEQKSKILIKKRVLSLFFVNDEMIFICSNKYFDKEPENWIKL